MKKTVKTELIVKTFQETIRRTNEMYQGIYENKSPEMHSGAIGAIQLLLGLIIEPLGIKVATPDHVKLIKRIWKVDNRAKYNQTHANYPLLIAKLTKKVSNPDQTVSKSTQFISTNAPLSCFTPEYLAELKTRAAQSCRCDGGNTNGCSACVAERYLERYKTLKGYHKTESEHICS